MRGALLVSWGQHDDETTPAAKMIALRALSDVRAVTFRSPMNAEIYAHVEWKDSSAHMKTLMFAEILTVDNGAITAKTYYFREKRKKHKHMVRLHWRERHSWQWDAMSSKENIEIIYSACGAQT